MKKIRFASPTYIVRNECHEDLFGVLEKLSDIGFDGTELIGLFGRDAKDIRKKADSLSGFQIMGNHMSTLIFSEEPEKTIDDHQTLGCEYITLTCSVQEINEFGFDVLAEKLLFCAEKTREAGMIPLYHNHGYEYIGEKGKAFMDTLIERYGGKELLIEPDIGWMMYAGRDPFEFLKMHKDKCPVLHLKDIYADDLSVLRADSPPNPEAERDPNNGGFCFRPTGYGIVNFPKLIPLCLDCKPDWIIPDHDLAYGRDSFTELKMSLEYTKSIMGFY